MAPELTSNVERATARALRRLEGRTALVIEDDEDVRELTCAILEVAGATVWSAGNSEDAVAAFVAHRSEVVVSDLTLPGEDGCDVLRRLRALAANELPAIAVSGWTQAEAERSAREAGFGAYIRKPVQPHVLLRAVEQLLAGEAAETALPESRPSPSIAQDDAGIREILAELVPLVADGCAFDRVAADGTRACQSALHVSLGRQRMIHDAANGRADLAPGARVGVSVQGTAVGELVVWRAAPLVATEEALLCMAAERIGELLERRVLEERVANATRERAALLGFVAEGMAAPLQALTVGLAQMHMHVRDSAGEIPRHWLLDRVEGLGASVDRLRGLTEQVSDFARAAHLQDVSGRSS